MVCSLASNLSDPCHVQFHAQSTLPNASEAHRASDVELRLAEQLWHKHIHRVLFRQTCLKLQRIGASSNAFYMVAPTFDLRAALPFDVLPARRRQVGACRTQCKRYCNQ